MKTKLKVVVYCAIAALVGVGSGALDNIQHSRQVAAQLNSTCKSKPMLETCVEREIAVRSVRYFFNGQEIRDGFAVTGLGANE
jgi:hypothetical protein